MDHLAGRLKRIALIGIACLSVAGILQAGVGVQVAATDVWSRPTPPGTHVGVVYLTLTNHGRMAERLLRLRSPIATAVQLHETRMENGLMSMRAVPFIDLPAGGEVTATPGGLHVMLLGLKAPISAGVGFPLTLVFAHGGELTVSVTVRAAP